jgi:(R,R)-butanediol dehydrogenase/meso-butanediol dehydrogenase/diacetyl reductase
MRAAVFEAPGLPLVVRDVAEPAPGPLDLVLRVRACGICGSDLHLAHEPGGLFGRPPPPGTVMGHEFIGEVVACGSDVVGWGIGERVVAMPVFACGACRACREGRPLDCRAANFIGLGGARGGFAEYLVVPNRLSHRVPDGLPDAVAALVEPMAVALHAMRLARLQPDDVVLVVGAGPVGIAITLWCRHFGVAELVISDVVAERAMRGKRLGANAWIDAARDDTQAWFRAHGGRRPDVVFDAAGGTNGTQRCIDFAAARGRIVVVAVHCQPSPIATMTAFMKELTLVFAKAYTEDEFREALEVLAKGEIDPGSMITQTVGFAGFPAAFQALSTPQGQCKILLDPVA